MLKIRLRRPGKSIKGRTHQKIVVTEKKWARESKFIDQLGYYDPALDLLKIDTEKYKEWIGKGAQPSETVASLFRNYGKPKKVKKKKPGPEEVKKQEQEKEKQEEGQKTEKQKEGQQQAPSAKKGETKELKEAKKESKESETGQEKPE